MYVFAIFWIWFGSAVGAAIVGNSRQAALAGFVLGLFLGPLGIVAAFALDGRPCCPHCAGRLDGRGQICQHCQRPLRWEESGSGSIQLPSLIAPRSSADFMRCPHCSAALRERSAECPDCGGAITWAKGRPIKVMRTDSGAFPPLHPSERPWSQFRGSR
jgi:Double zinc ribbon